MGSGFGAEVKSLPLTSALCSGEEEFYCLNFGQDQNRIKLIRLLTIMQGREGHSYILISKHLEQVGVRQYRDRSLRSR